MSKGKLRNFTYGEKFKGKLKETIMTDLTTQAVSLYDTKKLRKKQRRLHRNNEAVGELVQNLNRQNQTSLGNILAGLEQNATKREAAQAAADKKTQRAANQKGIVNSPREYYGNVTVKDEAKGKYVSATPKEAEAIRANNARLAAENARAQAQEVPRLGTNKSQTSNWKLVERNGQYALVPFDDEKRAKRAANQKGIVNSPRAYKGNMTVYDAKSGKYVSATPDEAKAIQARNAELAKATAPQEQPVSTSKKGVKNTSKEAQRLHESRALAQNGQVNSPREYYGNVTVKDEAKGKYVSATPKEAEAIRANNARLAAENARAQAQEVPRLGTNKSQTSNWKLVERNGQYALVPFDDEKRAKRAANQKGIVNSPRAYKGNMTVYDAKSGKYVSATPDEAKAIQARNAELAKATAAKPAAESVVQDTAKQAGKKGTSKIGGFFGKIAKGMKGKGGKIGLIIAGAAALIAGAIALFGKKKGSQAAEADEAQEQPVVTPTAPEETTPEETTPTVPVIPETPESSLQGIYTVVKGDCVWNIAKARLKELNGTDPTDAEIQKEVYRIMDKNKDANSENGTIKLEWEPDHYHVMIRPGDKIDLSA